MFSPKVKDMLGPWILLIAAVWATSAPAETRLLMIEQAFCEWCETWDAEVGVVYELTAEGRRAPLMRAEIDEPLPAGVVLVRPARYTPTFIVLRDGQEVGRIDGYPGEDFFYSMLSQLLDKAEARTAEPDSASREERLCSRC
jgi:hypothetical protein